MAASTESIRKELREFLQKELASGEDATTLTDETSLFARGILDSISVLQWVVFMEKKFGIKLRGQDLTRQHLNTIASAAELVHSRIGS